MVCCMSQAGSTSLNTNLPHHERTKAFLKAGNNCTSHSKDHRFSEKSLRRSFGVGDGGKLDLFSQA